MITHIIYHIPGLKFGCTKNLKKRKQAYSKSLCNQIILYKELYDKTDQEAGDIEKALNDEAGYKNGQHYGIISREKRIENGHKGGSIGGRKGALLTHKLRTKEQQFEISSNAGRAGMANRTIEQRTEFARIGAAASNLVTTSEQRSEWGRMGGYLGGIRRSEVLSAERASEIGRIAGAASRLAALRRAELGIVAPPHPRSKCPYCGIEANLGNLVRWHFDNCPHKPRPRLIRRAP